MVQGQCFTHHELIYLADCENVLILLTFFGHLINSHLMHNEAIAYKWAWTIACLFFFVK